MSLPKSRSASDELHYGCHEGDLQLVGKDWSVNHPDIELPEHVCCGPGCACPDHVDRAL